MGTMADHNTLGTMVLETLINYFTGRKRTLAESDLPIDAEHVQGGSKRFRNANSQPQSADRTYTTSQPLLPTSSRPPAAHPAPSNAPSPLRSESVPVQHSKSLSSLDTNKRITIAPPTLAPSNFKFTYTASQTLPSSITSASTTTPRPERKLKKNPNGPISYNGQWKSSKKLNRHASPAFQVPTRKPRTEAKDTYEVPADSKRRKVSEAEPSKQADSQSVPPGQASSTLATAPTAAPRTTTAVSPPKPSSVPSLPRLRTPAKPTTPAKPSPLRQTWSNQPTQTATLMAELINKTEIPKKPDVSNPYQTANPVANAIPPRRATRRTKKPLDRGAMQKAKAEAEVAAQKAKELEAAEKEKDRVPYVSAQAQIEATLPPGSKRSRPPANLMQQSSSSSSQITPKSYIVEEVTDVSEDSSRSAKRSKPSPASEISATFKSPSGVVSEPTIVDLDEVDTSSKGKGKQQVVDTEAAIQRPSVPSPTTPSPFGGNVASRQPPMTMKSIPKEPSKLRNSFFPETTTSSPTSSSGAQSPPPATFAFTTVPSAAAPAAKPDPPFSFLQPPQGALNITTGSKASVLQSTPPSSSSLTFKPAIPSLLNPSTPASKDARDETMDVDNEAGVKARVRAMDEKSLPVYDFVLSSPGSPMDTARDHVRARDDVKVLPAAALPSFAFDGAEGMKAGAAPSSGFKFDLPGSSGSSSGSGSYSKSLFGATPTPTPAPVAPTPAAGGFNWAAAGMKAPETKDKWVCVTCAVPNKKEDNKCVACESDRPGGAAAAAGLSSSTTSFGSFAPKPVEVPKPPAVPAVAGFNWAAAGMKAPDMSNKWICAACDVENPQSATKCVSCETDKAGAAAPSSSFKPTESTAPKPPAAPAVVGFNWAAAGMKVPDTSDQWICAACDVPNTHSAKKCVSCETDRLGAASSSSSASTSLFGSPAPAPVEAPKPPVVPAVVGFNWAASGMKAPDTNDKWTCSQCGLLSAQKSLQCETCDADRPGAAASSSSSLTASTTPKSSLFGSSMPTPVEAPTPPAVPAVVGFNWAAAGMKAPDTDNKWTCSQCGLLSDQKSLQCETCDNPR